MSLSHVVGNILVIWWWRGQHRKREIKGCILLLLWDEEWWGGGRRVMTMSFDMFPQWAWICVTFHTSRCSTVIWLLYLMSAHMFKTVWRVRVSFATTIKWTQIWPLSCSNSTTSVNTEIFSLYFAYHEPNSS